MFSRRRHHIGAATLTTAVAAALVTGLTTPASSFSTALPGGTATAAAAAKGVEPIDRDGGGKAAAVHWVTLVTGDRVGVSAEGKAVALDPAEGRAGIPVHTFTQDGGTHVVPADARALIASGRLDRRLFDVTELARAESRAAYREGLKVIVAYGGGSGSTARKGLRATGGVRVDRNLPVLDADAVTIPVRKPGALWASLVRTGAEGARTAPGVRHIWLDSVYTASLDRSVAQIGAPAAWQAGLDGTGVTIAVLDTGVDRTHPDLTSRVVAEKNFSDSKDAKDRQGHGTHVASIAAGTGARSGGKLKGVAPGAAIINSKVLGDSGSGTASGIIGGIDWAVAQGADVINMSLGAPDSPGTDPVEAHVDKVARDTGVLFAVAAGNDGPAGASVNSPASVERALSVGAVDDEGGTAPFSSRGPTAAGLIKPDVAAPGMDITAAAAAGTETDPQSPAGYTTLSGTSMASPHVAGAAALLKQRHPGWKGERLKAALVASARDLGLGAVEQGTGRVAVDRALGQNLVAEPASIGFARQSWPHQDDTPETRRLTYRNLGGTEVTLDLKVTGQGPRGTSAPAGFFTLSAQRVTVPAGGTASVDLSADTRVGGKTDGYYTATVVATGGGQTVRTVAGVDREREQYDLTVKYIGRDGKPTKNMSSLLHALFADGGGTHMLDDEGSSVTVRLVRGDYVLSAAGPVDGKDYAKGYDLLTAPRVSLTKDTTVTVDARRAKPVSITVPDKKAKLSRAELGYVVGKGAQRDSSSIFFDSLHQVRTGHVGAQAAPGTFAETWATRWKPVGSKEYATAGGGPVRKYSTGYTKKYKAGDFATVKAVLASSVKGKYGEVSTVAEVGGNSSRLLGPFRALPGTWNLLLASDPGATWSFASVQSSDKGHDPGSEEIWGQTASRAFRAGATFTETLGTGVHTPWVRKGRSGVFREGNRIHLDLAFFTDGRGHATHSVASSAKAALYRGTTGVGEVDFLRGETFTVGAEPAEYTLTASAVRDKKVSRVASRIDAGWTFRSERPARGTVAELPVSSVRFSPKLALDNTTPAGKRLTVPVTVEGPAAGKGLKSLTVSVSHDGTTWKKVPVSQGAITVTSPAKGKAVSFRAQIVDTRDNRSTITVHNAYHGR
ncbi:S8 family peptidase [Streptomyces sp. NPDC000594]|uniref:S8 family peptidase n=1 Tax=Streptomyces sp. NPDC000594 TaxID=3154261 RepID=UPI00332DFCA8